jgi:methylglyoxal reductase
VTALAGVSRLAYGAWAIDGAFGPIDRATAIGSVRAYLEEGGTLIDTARAYGDSEALVGEALRAWTGPEPLVATKILPHGPREAWGRPLPLDVVFPPGSIRASLERSLRELRRDHVDLLQLHMWWPTWGVSGRWLDELHELRDEGKALAIGVSLPDHRHDIGIELAGAGTVASIMTLLNIFDPKALDCLAPRAAEHGVALLVRSVLDEGGLTGVVGADTRFAADDFRREYFTARTRREYVARVEELRAAWIPGTAPTLAALALRFALSQPQVASAVVSMQTEELVRANMALARAEPLAADVLDRLGTRHRWTRIFAERYYFDQGWGPDG